MGLWPASTCCEERLRSTGFDFSDIQVMAITSESGKSRLYADDWTNEVNVCRSSQPAHGRCEGPAGTNSPGGFPPSPCWRMLEASHRQRHCVVLRWPLFARPYDAEAIASHRSSQLAPERVALRPVHQGSPHNAHGGPGLVHQRR